MHFLRTTSTARLLALLTGAVVAVAATAAIALAATSGSVQKPPPEPLAQAVHDALSAPKVDGVTARVKFTNHLIDSSVVTGSNPLLGGANGRLWASTDGKLRIELQSADGGGDVQLVSDGKSFMLYDGGSNTVYKGQIPQHKAKPEPADSGPPSLAKIQQAIDKAKSHLASLSDAIPAAVAGRPAYEASGAPNGGLLSQARVAWDSGRGVPLRVSLYARGNGSPVLELSATRISYGPVDASVFDISPPAGAKVVDLSPKQHDQGSGSPPPLSFTPSEPASLQGRTRQETKRIGDGVLVTYGQGLDGIAVIERKADPAQQQSAPAHGDRGVQLPTVQVNGTTGQELPTALGTVVRFSRGGVDYVVLGSLPADTVLAAAREL